MYYGTNRMESNRAMRTFRTHRASRDGDLIEVARTGPDVLRWVDHAAAGIIVITYFYSCTLGGTT